ncbi:PaaX family transcriptional regulator C-terminal domain-containing protein [Pseudonocardia sp. MH-G8]|uniref:PaaX family transcriptional regulator n=1 Tax=Pseudonocardia sp. MH-G8 TaxID=1854588 RepID=UPI000B9FD9D1|nr:PaaX family transcriptional regulator C-terminal domain-containing protein [Pseudonocardia sp. MH-G8]OZM76764.1 PaaX family transcriptional regulator [Pseudonocardia sp. MH-G8]
MAEIAPRRLILTLYGLYARDEHNWMSVSSVVRLMGDLGVDSTSVRSSVSRLKRRNVLRSMKSGSAAGYALSDSALEVLREGDVRIFDRRQARESDGFVLVVFSIPESEREKRHTLRTTLSGMGFGTAAPGVWVAPGHLREEVGRTLERRGLSSYVDLFMARHDGFSSLRRQVAGWWDLDSINAEYGEFLARFSDAQTRWKRSEDGTRTAFEIYVPMLTVWRRLPYLDPGLPLELLPEGWNGGRAAGLFSDLDALLRTPAREHALTTIHS